MNNGRKVILIACVKSKQDKPAPACDLYVSDWFKSALAYARKLSPDVICVLSAKYGLLELEQANSQYDEIAGTKAMGEGCS